MNKIRRITVSGKIDLRSLATIVKWLVSNGIRPSTKSDALHMSIETLADQVMKTGAGTLFTSVDEAIGYLSAVGLEFHPDKKTKQGRELFTALTLPELDTPEDLRARANLQNDFEEALAQFRNQQNQDINAE